MADPVNHPSHYNQGKIECIDALESALSPAGFQGFCAGTVITYLWRYQHKVDPVEDCRKAQWYTDRLIVHLEEAKQDDKSGGGFAEPEGAKWDAAK